MYLMDAMARTVKLLSFLPNLELVEVCLVPRSGQWQREDAGTNEDSFNGVELKPLVLQTLDHG
jgi:hypothetical protein